MPTKPSEVSTTVRKTKQVSLQLRVEFTNTELLEKGKLIAENHRSRQEFEDQLATVKSQFKSKIEGVEAKINELSGHLTAGWEYRPIVCVVTYDDPATGKKTTRRTDSSFIVSVEEMTLHEMQAELPLNPDVAGVAKDGTILTKGDRS